jgi:hypothetical protein
VTTPPIAETEADRRVLHDVAVHGWHVIRVPEQGRTPGWAFSVGLHHSYAHPEVIIFGLPLDGMQTLINAIGSDVVNGASHPAGSSSDRILEGYRCDFQPVARCWYEAFLGYAIWFYGGKEFPAMQCRWPDRDGHLPDHPDFDGTLWDLQPLLEHESPPDARVEALLHSLDKL